MSGEQLVLSLNQDERATFDNFFLTEGMQLWIETLKHNITFKQSEFIVFTGGEATGKSHLLKACCQFAHEKQQSSLYLPFGDLYGFDPETLFEKIRDVWLLCLDDVDVIALDHAWQTMLFKLYNERKEKDLPLYFSLKTPVHFSEFTLADLKSRLAACLSVQMKRLSDDDKLELIRLQALRRGMLLNEQCATYIIQHYGRELRALMEAIDQLDAASLQAGRKLTVPFIKSVLGADKMHISETPY